MLKNGQTYFKHFTSDKHVWLFHNIMHEMYNAKSLAMIKQYSVTYIPVFPVSVFWLTLQQYPNIRIEKQICILS